MRDLWHPISERPRFIYGSEISLCFLCGVRGIVFHTVTQSQTEDWEYLTQGMEKWCYYIELMNAKTIDLCRTCKHRTSRRVLILAPCEIDKKNHLLNDEACEHYDAVTEETL